jgi:hypothetical protein
MDLNLGLLREMHPRLEFTTAREYAYRAAVGLERHNHTQGAALAVHLDSRRRAATLSWPDRADDGGQQRLKEKAAQLAGCRLPGVTKVACVVELRPPRTRVRTV